MIRTRPPVACGRDHLAALAEPLRALELEVDRIDAWGRHLARLLTGGGRLLVAGNGGSAAQAQHLTAELVGRYRDERPAMSALALHAETSSLTAIVNDYGAERGFARQVEAHGRPGDVLLALSTSGRSPNLLAAADAAHACGLTAWALTGPRPNPLSDRVSDAVCVDAEATATIQEIHQIVVHMVCAAVDVAIGTGRAAPLAVVAEAR